MAIGKSVSGKGFKGASQYILNKKDAEFLYARNVFTDNPDLIAKQMRAVADARSITSPVMHFSISLNKGERGTDEQWQLAADAFMKNMGFDLDHAQYVVARHQDTEHDHIHILVNRVQLNNTVVNDFQHQRRVHEATRAAELAAGFKVFESKQERELRKTDVRDKIDGALENSKNWRGIADYEKFKVELEKVGVIVHENRSQTTGRLNGISYETSDHKYKGSSLGKEYSLGGLEKRGLDAGRYQQQSHRPTRRHAHNANTAASATQARVNAEQSKKDTHTSKAKQSANEDENKRLQAIKQAENEDEDEM
ncbi:MAG: hypothetical protein CTY10_01215 [Methylotenera sp.]|nr:MAG: hypothetical protein CTY10_01215 [Methylotenera sp.]